MTANSPSKCTSKAHKRWTVALGAWAEGETSSDLGAVPRTPAKAPHKGQMSSHLYRGQFKTDSWRRHSLTCLPCP